MNAVTRLLRDLVAIPSVNPRLLGPDVETPAEEPVAEYLSVLAKKHGLDVSRQAVLPGRRNLLVRLKPSGKVKKRILLAPHMDVVPADDSQFKPSIHNGRLYGRGACDTKGCIAAYFHALCQIAKYKQRLQHTEIIFLGLIDEEHLQSGSRAYARNGPKADLAIVGEPTRLQIITAHKGDFWWQLKVVGKAAHGATPHLGKSAVHQMARTVEILLTEYNDSLKEKQHPLLGSPTINIGVIQGGTQPNIVPDTCSIDIDRRTLPGETENTVRKEILDVLKPHGLKPDFLDLRGVPCDALETDPALPLVQRFMKVARRRRTLGADFFTDASPLASAGIPAILYGPGDIAQAHTSEEWIDLTQLEQATEVVKRFLQEVES